MSIDDIKKAQKTLNTAKVPTENRSSMGVLDHVVDDKGSKWLLVGIYNDDMRETVYVLQPYPESDEA